MISESKYGASRLPADAGLTLIELLISLTLLALLTAALPSTMQLVTRAWKTSAAIVTVAPGAANLNILEQRLAEAMPLTETTANGERGLAFRGTADALTFVSPLLQGPAGAGLYRFEVYAAASDATAAAVPMLRVSPFVPDSRNRAAPAAGDERPLLRVPATMNFRYYGSPKLNEPPVWQPAWTRTDTLPQMVELSLRNASAPDVEAPPLRVVLRLGQRV
jgi:prepilin-type N-terminal cleavage/methylation domain-containing protein